MGYELGLILILFIIALYAYLIRAVYLLSERLGHTSVLHTILAVVATPILPLLYLSCAGETDFHRKTRIEQEEKWRIAISKAEQDAN
jgi:hypothetical protein